MLDCLLANGISLPRSYSGRRNEAKRSRSRTESGSKDRETSRTKQPRVFRTDTTRSRQRPTNPPSLTHSLSLSNPILFVTTHPILLRSHTLTLSLLLNSTASTPDPNLTGAPERSLHKKHLTCDLFRHLLCPGSTLLLNYLSSRHGTRRSRRTSHLVFSVFCLLLPLTRTGVCSFCLIFFAFPSSSLGSDYLFFPFLLTDEINEKTSISPLEGARARVGEGGADGLGVGEWSGIELY